MEHDMSTTMEQQIVDISQLPTQWARIRGRLQSEVGELEYRNWLRQMTLAGIDGDEITVLLPTRFLCDWVRSRYGDRLNTLWHAENPAIRRVDIRVGGAWRRNRRDWPKASPRHQSRLAVASEARGTDGPAPRPGARPSLHLRRLRRRQAERIRLCLRAPGCRAAVQPRLQSAVPLWRRRPRQDPSDACHRLGAGGARQHRRGRPVSVAYMSAEKFMYRFIAAIRSQSTMQFKEQLRSVDVLMIDDLQFLIGKDNTQEEFFHTFNALVDVGKQIVVSADKSPSDLSGLEDRLRTRLGYGMVADLHATTFELRISILEAKAARAGVAVPAKVMEFLAHKITTNVRELEGALNRLVAHANLFGRPVTLEATQEVLHDILKAHDRRVTIEEIQKKRRRALQHPADRHDVGTARARGGAAAAGGDVPGQAAHPAQPAGDRPQVRQPRPHHGDARRLPGGRADGRDAGFAEDVELLRRMLES